MRTIYWRICDLAERQHDVVAVWQLKRLGLSRSAIDSSLRGWRRVHHGVCARGELTELGWFMGAALAGGPGAAVSHGSALTLLGLRDEAPPEIHVSVPGNNGRGPRDGLRLHRRKAVEAWRAFGIPVTSPSQSIRDSPLEPYELYRALEAAADLGYALTLPRNAASTLNKRVRGRTRSDAEARFILLCHDQGLPLPLVNQYLNGILTDFHWPRAKLVVEVDGWEFHRERPQFEEDRRRGLVHNAHGYTVTRVSALQVQRDPELVAAAIRERLR